MFRTVLIVLFVLISCSPSAADKEARPYPYVATANNGRFYFKMSPDPNDPNAQWDLGKGYGTLFEINNDGTEKHYGRLRAGMRSQPTFRMTANIS